MQNDNGLGMGDAAIVLAVILLLGVFVMGMIWFVRWLFQYEELPSVDYDLDAWSNSGRPEMNTIIEKGRLPNEDHQEDGK